MAKILVSFKEKERDLYEIVMQQGDKSNFIKDALKFYLKYNKKEKNTEMIEVKDIKKDEILDLLQGL